MSNLNTFVYDNAVVTVDGGYLVADDTEIWRMVASRQRRMRRQSVPTGQDETEQDDMLPVRRSKPKCFPRNNRTEPRNPYWSEEGRAMRRLTVQYRNKQWCKFTDAELADSLSVPSTEELCEGCTRLPGFCICSSDGYPSCGCADEHDCHDYAAYQKYCRDMLLMGCTPLSFNAYVMIELSQYGDSLYDPYWDSDESFLDDYHNPVRTGYGTDEWDDPDDDEVWEGFGDDDPDLRADSLATSEHFVSQVLGSDSSDFSTEADTRFVGEY